MARSVAILRRWEMKVNSPKVTKGEVPLGRYLVSTWVVIVFLVGLFLCSPLLNAQTKGSKGQPIRITTITNSEEPASAEVMKSFRQKVASHPNLFLLVGNQDDSQGLVFTANCMQRDTAHDEYVCFYTNHYAGGTSKTFFGGGLYATKSADDMADNLLAAMSQDIVERWNDIARANAIERLESCLFLTQSSCAVP